MFSRRSLLLLSALAGCSTPGDMLEPDASPAGDGSLDGAAPPTTGIANVVVSGYSSIDMPPHYFADVSVVVYKPDGSVSEVVKTDAMGRASATIERSSLVVIVNPMNYPQVQGAIANPGDTLHFGPDLPSREPNGSVRVTWPARVISGYTTYYYVYTSCGYSGETTGTSITLPLYQGCSSNPFDVVVTSRRSSQEVTGVMVRRSVQATGGLVTVNLADNGGAWQIGSFTNIELTNVPNSPSSSRSCSAVQYLGPLSFNSTGDYTTTTTCSMRLLPEPLSTWAVEASFVRDNETRFAVQMRQPMSPSAIASIDSADHLPWITSVAFDAATRQVTWSSDADEPFDASALQIEVTGSRHLSWRIVAPNGLPKTFTLPALPPDLAMLDLRATDTALTSLVNMDFVGVTPADFMAHDLEQEQGFTDKPRRGATARTE